VPPNLSGSGSGSGSGLSGAKLSNRSYAALNVPLTAADLMGSIASKSSAATEFELRHEISQQLRSATFSDKIVRVHSCCCALCHSSSSL
jgi:hypothetical protein